LEESSYFAQVKPRDINLFYIKDGLRERIEKKGDQWLVLNTDLQFSAAELEKELADHPESFSPNAALRPLYQEMILPNLAYIGGGGELAYWFQLKPLFDHLDLPMPMLVLRNSVLWVEKKWQNRLADMGLGPEIFFQPLHQLKKQLVMEKAPVDPHLHKYEQKLEQIFDELEDIAKLTEKSMLGAVNAQRQKQLNGLDNLKKKLLRAEKRRQAVDMDKLDRIYHALFPNGGLQERHDTLAPFYAAHGVDFIKTLLQQLKPLQFEFSIIKGK
jgi:bacillithiol biosynthesis cysteine-adding enzyme BshC